MKRCMMLLSLTWILVQSLFVVSAAAADSEAVMQVPKDGATASAIVPPSRITPSPLLVVDQNRSTVVDRIVRKRGAALANAGVGINAEQLRDLLTGLRSDYLLAASLAGTNDGLRDVIANALVSTADVKPSLLHTKALGDTADDLVYTPVTPCRIVDTRSAGGALGSFSSRDFKVWVSSGGFGAQGGASTNCGIPANPVAVVVNITAVTPAGAGNFIAYPTGTPSFTSVLNYQTGENALANGAIVPACIPNCTNQLTIATNGAGADVVIDIAGYFKPPSGSVQPSNIVWVAPSGGNYTTIQAAINAAAAAASAAHPYLVRIAPGIYTEQVTLKDFVDVEGSGTNMTTIQYSISSPTVIAGAAAQMRFLTVINTFNGSAPGANAIAQSSNSVNGATTLVGVNLVADGPSDNLAVFVTGGFLAITLSDVEAAPSGTQTTEEAGVWASGATANVVVQNSKLAASSGLPRLSAHQDSGALIRIDNTQLKGTTSGTPLCFQTFIGSTYTAAACP